MIKFFRKIRYDLMKNNKSGKYLKYAFGEIILVVIGILIALQINNWNDNRIANNNELKLIASLNEELISIRDELKIDFESNNKNLKQVEEYLDEIEKNNEQKIKIVSFLDIYSQSSVSHPIITNVLSANSSSSISDDKLLKELRKLQLSYNKIKESELYLDQLWNSKISDFLSRNNYAKSLVNYTRTQNSDGQNLIELYDNSEYKNIIALKWLMQSDWVRNQRIALTETEKVIVMTEKK